MHILNTKVQAGRCHRAEAIMLPTQIVSQFIYLITAALLMTLPALVTTFTASILT